MFKSRYGRINRATYLLCFAILVAVYAVLLTFISKPPALGEFLALMIAVPRLHDIGKSCWWAGGVIVAELVVVFGSLAFVTPTGGESTILIAGGLFVMAALALMVWLGCIRGQPDANLYGEPPPPGISLKSYSLKRA